METNSQFFLNLHNTNPSVLNIKYAVRGPIVQRSAVIKEQLRMEADEKKMRSAAGAGEEAAAQQVFKFNFSSIIQNNIGDCHATGQRPITFFRQVLALVNYPDLIGQQHTASSGVLFPEDVCVRATSLLDACAGRSIGSYTTSSGLPLVRRHVADYIDTRDGEAMRQHSPAQIDNIFLTGGATTAIKRILQLVATRRNPEGTGEAGETGVGGGKRSGIMIPIPQYPLYTASISEFDSVAIPYYLEEATGWGLNEAELERSISEAKAAGECVPRAIVLINPGNPTGQVMTRRDIELVLRFADKHRLVVLADEVYQFNVYPKRGEGGEAGQKEKLEFVSCRRVKYELGGDIWRRGELCSFMSASKGYMGECGFRAGYCELINFSDEVRTKLQNALNANLCSSVSGQVMLDLVVKPPSPEDPSYAQFEAERSMVLRNLSDKAHTVWARLNSLPGMHCQRISGAMYAFPRLELPERFLRRARDLQVLPDELYCAELLEATGVCVVPGSGFGQQADTWHFRTTILPDKEVMQDFLERLAGYHERLMRDYQ